MAFDDYIDPQRGDIDVPDGARRVRRYGCPCEGCTPSWWTYGPTQRPPEHDDRLFPVYGPPEPYQPRHAAPSQETAA